MNINGYTIYEGPSAIDGAPIAAVMTLHSVNAKTGDIATVWILPAGVTPSAAIKCGADESVCGDCPLRGDGTGKERACYVVPFQAPNTVWRTWKRGRYPMAIRNNPAHFLNLEVVRWGGYGDPAALPQWKVEETMQYIDTLRESAKLPNCTHLGYTHQWTKAKYSWTRDYFMASVDHEGQLFDAWESGWSTFRGLRPDEEPASIESMCSSLKGVTCAQCKRCTAGIGKTKHITVPIHGTGKKHY